MPSMISGKSKGVKKNVCRTNQIIWRTTKLPLMSFSLTRKMISWNVTWNWKTPAQVPILIMKLRVIALLH